MRMIRQTTRRITKTTMMNAVSSTTSRTAAMNPWKKVDSQVSPAAGKPAPSEGSEVSGAAGTGVRVGAAVGTGVSVDVGDGVMVGVLVAVGDGVIVGVSVGVGEGVMVGVAVGTGVLVGGTWVGRGLGVLVGSG